MGAPRVEKRTRLSDTVYGRILEDIARLGLPQDTRLKTEHDYAREFGVSRPIVREALARLREDGVIYSRRGSGTYLNRPPSAAIGRFAPITSIADIQRCFEYRMAVESMTARLAALRWDDEALDHIERALRAFDDALADRQPAVELDLAFHLTIARASKNHFLVAALEHTSDQIEVAMNLVRNLSLLRSDALRLAARREHTAIVEAIRARDGDLAGARMVEHLQNSKTRVFEGVDENGAAR
jgi:GntR family transcriptional repressor for pyruvate dehydrogenase complex